jgi:trk system potassium uptake protein TrkH
VNFRRVIHMLGVVLYVIACAQLFPLIWCVQPVDLASARALLLASGLTAALGLVFRLAGNDEGELYRRDGVLVVVGAWGLASLTGAIPYLISGAIPQFADALFESVSGFTTTGASILVDIEAMPRALLFWRSLTQWLGGIGIVVLFVALLSELGPGARFLFKLEVPGPKAEIMHSHVRETAVVLSRIYVSLSVLQCVFMLLLGASLFEAMTHTFSTVSTGGFSPYADSAGHFAWPIQLVILIFMIGSGINFSLYLSTLRLRSLAALRDAELRGYLAITVAATLAITVDLIMTGTESGLAQTLLDSAFHTVSILTTTGFATQDYDRWPGVAHAVLMSLMLVGGCAGSTAGGPKVIRLLISARVALREVRLTFSPNAVIAIAIGDQTVPEESARAVTSLLLLWVLGWGVGTLALAVGDTPLVTAATASLATLSNVGPGLAEVGPTGNFAFFASWQKLVMVLLMWLGRLEFFALLSLFLPRFWRR